MIDWLIDKKKINTKKYKMNKINMEMKWNMKRIIKQ